jgi:hypothetical protein
MPGGVYRAMGAQDDRKSVSPSSSGAAASRSE